MPTSQHVANSSLSLLSFLFHWGFHRSIVNFHRSILKMSQVTEAEAPVLSNTSITLEMPQVAEAAEAPVLSKTERMAAKKARKLARRKARAEAAAKGLPPPQFFSHHNLPSSSSSTTTTSSSTTSTGHTFASKFNDHFETPSLAYSDLAPLLLALNASSKIIYDPFYCKGSMVQHLGSLGFNNVINKNEDFWRVLDQNALPTFDICVTNPPYSDRDKERTVDFIIKSKKPGFVLLPSYCGNKAWLERARGGQKCFVVRPHHDYQYQHIAGKGHATSPFHSSWFCFNCDFDQMKRISPLVQELHGLTKVGVSFKKRLSSKRRKAMNKKRKRSTIE